MKTGAVLFGIAALLAAKPASAADIWYAARYGAEPCVRLDDLNDDFSRSYYGNGTLHTPADLARAFQGPGEIVTRDPRSNDDLVIYRVVNSAGATNIMLIRGKSMCEALMRGIEK